MAFVQTMSLMITSLIILNTIPSTKSIALDRQTEILIDDICKQTASAYDCKQSIIPKLHKPHAEITTIANIAAFNALYISKITYAVIRDDYLPKADPSIKSQLLGCLRTYDGVEKYLEGAYQSFIHNQYQEMRRYQSFVLGLLDNCEAKSDLMVRKNWWTRLMVNISMLAAWKLPGV